MIQHYYDPWSGRQHLRRDVVTTNIPMWTATSGLNTMKSPQIDVVKSEKFVTLVIRNDAGTIVSVVDLSVEEATDLAEKLTHDNDS